MRAFRVHIKTEGRITVETIRAESAEVIEALEFRHIVKITEVGEAQQKQKNKPAKVYKGKLATA